MHGDRCPSASAIFGRIATHRTMWRSGTCKLVRVLLQKIWELVIHCPLHKNLGLHALYSQETWTFWTWSGHTFLAGIAWSRIHLCQKIGLAVAGSARPALPLQCEHHLASWCSCMSLTHYGQISHICDEVSLNWDCWPWEVCTACVLLMLAASVGQVENCI